MIISTFIHLTSLEGIEVKTNQLPECLKADEIEIIKIVQTKLIMD